LISPPFLVEKLLTCFLRASVLSKSACCRCILYSRVRNTCKALLLFYENIIHVNQTTDFQKTINKSVPKIMMRVTVSAATVINRVSNLWSGRKKILLVRNRVRVLESTTPAFFFSESNPHRVPPNLSVLLRGVHLTTVYIAYLNLGPVLLAAHNHACR